MEQVDVVILGAGVAGLFVAHELIKQNFKGSITIVEQGLSMERRISQCGAISEALRGVGGSGFFTDGKICLDERAGTRLTEFIDSSVLRDYVAYIRKILQKFLPEEDFTPFPVNENQLTYLENELQAAGLIMDLSYPVVHLGTEKIRQLGLSFERFLRDHRVRFLTSTTAEEINPQPNSIDIKLEDRGSSKSIQCRYLIAAVGKSGHDWLCNQLKHWDVDLSPNSPDIGIRLEFPNSVTQPLINIVQNPRIIMKWDDTFIRTHCWCYGGRISTYNYLGYPVVDGETFKNSLTNYTGVSLLYRYKGSFYRDPVQDARALLQEIFLSNQGHPSTLSLGELRRKGHRYISETEGDSLSILREAHFEKLFPAIIIEGFLEFIRRLGKVYPGIADNSTSIFTPLIEWDTYKILVDENMCTSVPGVYMVGDGAGLTQGVVAAATSGIIAAKHLSQNFLSSQSTKKHFVEVMR